MNKSIFFRTTSATLLTLLISLFMFSCKEEEPDDPNITYVSINKSVTSVVAYTYAIDSVDINGDGRKDLNFAAVANPSADSAFVFLTGSAAAIYVDSTETLNSFYYKAKNMFKDQQPDIYNTKREWWQATYVGLRQGSTKKGYAGVGDVFIPIILTKVGEIDILYYGWVRVNVSTDYRTIKLVDAAFHINPDTPVKMGAK